MTGDGAAGDTRIGRHRRLTLPYIRDCTAVVFDRIWYFRRPWPILCSFPGPWIEAATDEELEAIRAKIERLFRREVEALAEKIEIERRPRFARSTSGRGGSDGR